MASTLELERRRQMKLKQRQKERFLTDRALAEEAGVSTATVYRAKKCEVSRPAVMEQIASALECKVTDIDEFHPALRERVCREAEDEGAPPEVLDQAEEVFEIGLPPSQETIQGEAYFLLKGTMDYLDRAGRRDLVDQAIRERRPEQ
jgi:DNA-binding Xre family transcriptional regulator